MLLTLTPDRDHQDRRLTSIKQFGLIFLIQHVILPGFTEIVEHCFEDWLDLRDVVARDARKFLILEGNLMKLRINGKEFLTYPCTSLKNQSSKVHRRSSNQARLIL